MKFSLMSKHARIFNRTALTFSQEVLKEPPRVVLWILQMDVGSPPGGRSIVWSLLCCTNRDAHHDGHSSIHSSRPLD